MPKSIRARAKEPSTYAGLATIILTLGQLIPAVAPIAHAVTPILGAIAVAMRENG